MKAIRATSYGTPEVLKMIDIPKPTPKPNEVLVKVYATSVHIGDTKIRRLEPGMGSVKDFLFKPAMRLMLGVTAPRNPLGMEVAGVVEQVGQGVTRFKVGDEVYVSTGTKMGGYAEYITIKEDKIIAKKPTNLSFEEAATVPNGAMVGLMLFRGAKLKSGQKVLIYGASGSVGTFAIQIAKAMGADVTAVCSTDNVEMVRSIGADKVIDYKTEDFTKEEAIYDVVLDAYGHIPKEKAKSVLKDGGVYLNVLTSTDGLKMTIEGLEELTAMIEAGKLKPVIDRTYNFEQIVEAHRYVDGGHKKGNVAVSVVERHHS